jgi:hypothetical protein
LPIAARASLASNAPGSGSGAGIIVLMLVACPTVGVQERCYFLLQQRKLNTLLFGQVLLLQPHPQARDTESVPHESPVNVG